MEKEKNVENKEEIKTKKPFYKNKKFWVIVLFVIISIGSYNQGITDGYNKKTNEMKAALNKMEKAFNLNSNEEKTEIKEAKTEEKKEKVYTLGDTIKFDEFEITLGTAVTFDKVKNQFAEENNKEVIKLPAKIKNVGTDTQRINQFYIEQFGTKGIKLKSVDYYFKNSISEMPEIRPDAEVESNFYLLYDGDGKYGIDFDKFGEKIKVEFEVKK